MSHHKKETPVNVLLIMADQWRGECLSIFDHLHVKTPHLDALAAEGVAFKHHYAQAVPCGPSRACVYTGMYMHNHRSLLNGTPLDARHTNIALEARKSGYKPALFGYTDVSLDPRQYPPEDYAIKSYEGVLPGFVPVSHITSVAKPWLADLKTKGYKVPDHAREMLKPQSDFPGSENMGKTFPPARFKTEDSCTAFLVDEAIKYLSVRQDKPWFVHMSFISPHPPYVVSEPFHDQYRARDMTLPVRRNTPEEEAALHPWMNYYLHNQGRSDYTVGAQPRDILTLPESELRQIRATYFGMISEVDAQIGRLIDYLKKTGAYDNTLIIFTSDHGDMLGDHWMLSKTSYFDQAFSIPLIIRDPNPTADSARGSVIEAFTENVDIMPTILERIKRTVPTQCDGRSLLPFCQGKEPTNWRQEYHAEFDLRAPYSIKAPPPLGLEMKQCGVTIIRGTTYKYVHFATLPPLFFDLEKDPYEFIDLSTDSDYRGKVFEYAGKMLSWRMISEDSALTDLHLTNEGVVSGLRSK